MARKNTNKHYSLRKLKTGTASVAVALTVLGAGLASQTEVKAEENERLRQAKEQALQEVLRNTPYDDLKNAYAGAFRKNDELEKTIQEKDRDLKDLNDALNNTILENIKSSNQHKKEIGELKSANEGLKTALDDMADTLRESSRRVSEVTAEAAKQEEKNLEALNSKNEQIATLVNENEGLKESLDNVASTLSESSRKVGEVSNENKALKEEAAKKEEQNKISEASRKGLRRDLNASREAKKQLEAEHQKLEEQNKISEASRKGLRRDLDASREAKKQVEKDLANLTAELDKVKEEKQISDASRQGLRRDLDASREAKKQVEKALEEANSKLAALEKLNKELEESKKLTEKEKAELQAKLEAEAKALKEKLAKQAEELAKLRAGKASDSQTPDAKPGNKVVPGKGQAPQAGTKPNQNKEPMKETKRQLPSTGEATNPFFTAAALAVMATAGVAAVVKRKEEN